MLKLRGNLFRKYAFLFVALVAGVMLASGITEIYFSYQENKLAIIRIQLEKALAASAKIDQFIAQLKKQISWVTPSPWNANATNPNQLRVNFIQLLRREPAITEVKYLDSSGREKLHVSRLRMDVVGSEADFSQDPGFFEAKAKGAYLGAPHFRSGSEPYMSIAVAGKRKGSGVTMADVNLKFVGDVISEIKVGTSGRAYVTDSAGNLIAHPDITLVLKKTNFSWLRQVSSARESSLELNERRKTVSVARDFKGQEVLTAYTDIPPLRWFVFIEQPLADAFKPLYASIYRTALLLLVGIALAVLASLILARRMVKPIQVLRESATRVGAGELDHRVELRTGDELESLGEEFNRMAAKLAELENVRRLKRFFSPQLSDLIVSSQDESLLKSHRREITVVFCDLRGFTAFSENQEPEEVMAILREFHETIGPMIFEYEGTLERFAGDGLMVFFNDPIPCPDPATKAVKMALAMRDGMDDLIRRWKARGYELDMGMGIAQGFATLGIIGFEGRFDYAAIGTVTNLASRLSDEARARQILINKRVYAEVAELVQVESVGELVLKGLHSPVTAYNVLGLK